MVLRLCGSLCLLALFYIPSEIVTAATTKPITFKNPRWIQDTNTGNYTKVVDAVFETLATTTTGQPVARYTTRPTPIPAASIARMARGAMGGPVGAALLGASLAYDMIYDETTQTWEIPQDPLTPWQDLTVNNSPQCDNLSIGQSTYRSHDGHIYSMFESHSSGNSIYSCSPLPSSYSPWQLVSHCPSSQISTNCQSNGGTPIYSMKTLFKMPKATYETYSQPPPIPVTDQEFTDTIAQDPNQKLIPNLASDSISSGRWRDEWPEAVTAGDTINDTLENDIEGATNPTTDPTVTDSASPLPPTDTYSPESPTAQEWPLFCEWATVVCDYIDWFKNQDEPLPEHPLIPERELEVQEYNSGIPDTAACPVNIPFQITFPIQAQYELDLVPVCDLASDIRPFVILSAYLVAAFVLVGSIRS